jgi:peroxiredoxin
MKKFSIIVATLSIMITAKAGGYQVGDKASDFKLKNVDGKYVSLSDYPDTKGFVVIFTCNHCPFAKAYQDRISEIDKIYKPKGFPVIAINPNDPKIVPEDSFDAMVQLSTEKAFTFPYLFDQKQEVYKIYGATHTPHVFLLKKVNNELQVMYIGAIDDNYQDANAVKEKYLANAIDAVIAGKQPDPDFTKAIGCSIKDNHVANSAH